MTISQLARELGVAKSTVSLALRGSPKVRPETTERVLEAARRHNYRPDPLLSALSSRRDNQLAHHRATVAVIWPVRKDPGLSAAVRQALAERGYGFDTFYAEDYPNPQRLADILKARGIPAILLPEHAKELGLKGFPWENFVTIQAGVGRTELPVDVVRYNSFDAVRLAWEKFAALGCRRIGGVFLHHGQRLTRLGEKQLAAYVLSQQLAGLPRKDRLPPHIAEVHAGLRDFPGWFEKNRPDAVIGPWHGFYLRHQELLKPREGFRGYIAIRAAEEEPRVAGFLVDPQRVQLASVTQLDHRLREIAADRAASPRFAITVEPIWQPGESLREE